MQIPSTLTLGSQPSFPLPEQTIAALVENYPLQKETRTSVDYALTSNDNKQINTRLYKNNSSTLLVLGQGFPGAKESLKYFISLFPDYDVVIFDYRWLNLQEYTLSLKTITNPTQYWIYDCIEDAKTVVHHFIAQKKYTEVIGLGICYSNFIFATLQAEAETLQQKPLFTKLILDSSWLSLEEFIRHICLDPWLPFSPQEGGCPEFIKKFLKHPIVHSTLSATLHLICPKASIEPQLNALTTTPILFIHGRGDLLVDEDNFNTLWAATPTPYKAAYLTSSRHSDNMYGAPELYSYLCSTFIQSPTLTEFNASLFFQG